MLIAAPNMKSLYRKIIVVWGISASLSMTALGQAPSNAAAQTKANELANKAFVQRFKEQPTSGYVGPVSTGKMFCLDVVPVVPTVCQVVIEYRNPTFHATAKGRPPADAENGVWNWTVIADFQISRVRHIADGTWGPWSEWKDRDKSKEATYEVMRLQYSNNNWTWEPGDDLIRFLLGWKIDSSQRLELADISNPAKHGQPPTPQNSAHCHDSLNHVVPVQRVARRCFSLVRHHASAMG